MGQIAEVIKYEGDNSTFIWKYPREDFNNLTQLIVHESQEAIFFLNGQALDMFGAGRHTLETQNIPKLGKYLNRTTDGDNPFHCEVYFINKTVQMAIKWGTERRMRFIEPTMGIPLEIGACGELNLEVSDSRKLLLKLVGTMNGIEWGDNAEHIQDYSDTMDGSVRRDKRDRRGFTKSLHDCFRTLISNAVMAHLPGTIKTQNINILEIDEHLENLSEILRKSIVPGFEEYGLTIPQFYVSNVALPENDPNFRRLRELHTVSLQTRMIQAEALVQTARVDAQASIKAAERKVELEIQTTETEKARREAERKVILAQAKAQADKMVGMAEAEVMAAKGYTERDVLAADVQKAYAAGIGNMTINGSGGGVVGDMLGLGVGMAAAGVVAPQLGEMFKGMNPAASAPAETATAKCAKCGAILPANAKFCLECGEKVAPVSADTVVCPECGKTIAKGKFCPECGHKFITVCPKCGKDVPAGAKFCLDCGEKL